MHTYAPFDDGLILPLFLYRPIFGVILNGGSQFLQIVIWLLHRISPHSEIQPIVIVKIAVKSFDVY